MGGKDNVYACYLFGGGIKVGDCAVDIHCKKAVRQVVQYLQDMLFFLKVLFAFVLVKMQQLRLSLVEGERFIYFKQSKYYFF